MGDFTESNGIDLIVQMAKRLATEGNKDMVQFDLAGHGAWEATIKENGVPENVRLLGAMDPAQLDAQFNASDAILLLARTGGMPSVVLDAMAHAKSVFVSDVGAKADLVSMYNGYLLPQGDAEALYQAVLAFCERKPETRVKMGLYSKARVLEVFDWNTATGRYLRLFHETLNAEPR